MYSIERWTKDKRGLPKELEWQGRVFTKEGILLASDDVRIEKFLEEDPFPRGWKRIWRLIKDVYGFAPDGQAGQLRVGNERCASIWPVYRQKTGLGLMARRISSFMQDATMNIARRIGQSHI